MFCLMQISLLEKKCKQEMAKTSEVNHNSMGLEYTDSVGQHARSPLYSTVSSEQVTTRYVVL